MIKWAMVKRKAKGGTHKTICHTAISVVGGVSSDCRTHRKEEQVVAAADKLLAHMRAKGVQPKLRLMVGGFFSKGAVLTMNRMNQTLWMPAAKNPRPVRMIDAHAAGAGKAVTQYAIRDKKGKVAATPAIVPRYARKDAPAKDRRMALATDARHTVERTLADNMPLKHKKRRGRGPGTGAQRVSGRAPTAGTLRIRMLHFYFALTLRNVRTLSIHLASGRVIRKDAYVRPSVASCRMTNSLDRACAAMIPGRKSPGPFFAEGAT